MKSHALTPEGRATVLKTLADVLKESCETVNSEEPPDGEDIKILTLYVPLVNEKYKLA